MEKLGIPMRSASIAVSLLISTLIFSIAPVQADVLPSMPPVISTDNYKAALEQYKHDRDIYMAALKDRSMKLSGINMTFKSAVDKSNIDARSALATATTPTQKSTIMASRKGAIDLAISARDISIAALGPIPTAPIEPIRPPKIMGAKESKEKKRG
jgi:hypothetical protein